MPGYLAKKYSSFLEILDTCRKIEETKLKKLSAFDKINASISKFILSAQYNYRDKSDMTTKGESINIPISKWAKDDSSDTDTEI